MALELSRKRPGTREARRIARKQIAEAVHALGNGPPSDEGVHAARKELKKARATLRLLRDALGKKRYQKENRALRDIARPLSEIRDGKVLLDTLDKLAEHGSNGHQEAASLRGLRRDLDRERTAVTRKLLSGSQPLGAQRDLLRAARRRASHWPVGRHGWSVLGSGLKRVYRAGREALSAAKTDPTPQRLHEWRKQTQYLWHGLRILEPLKPSRIGRLAERVHQLSEYLGNHHDLFVLRAKLLGARGTNPQDVLRLIESRGEELEQQAFALGRRLYKESPSTFHSHMGKYWRRWRG